MEWVNILHQISASSVSSKRRFQIALPTKATTQPVRNSIVRLLHGYLVWSFSKRPQKIL